MNTTPSPAREAVELPELEIVAWLAMGIPQYPSLQMHKFHERDEALIKRSDALKVIAAKDAEMARMRVEEVDKMTKHLQFVERWANHHAQKSTLTPQEVLSCIQHYPPILAITRSYADGKVPETPNPYAEVDKMREALEKISKLDPSTDSDEGFNEWGEAECFNKAQIIARAALSPTQGETHD